MQWVWSKEDKNEQVHVAFTDNWTKQESAERGWSGNPFRPLPSTRGGRALPCHNISFLYGRLHLKKRESKA